jgi:hypothetical protein
MSKLISFVFGMIIMVAAGFAAFSLMGNQRDSSHQTLGNLSNPKFAEIFNKEIPVVMQDVNKYYSLPTAKDTAQKAFSSIKEIVTYCSNPETPNHKINKLVFESTYVSGEKIKDGYTGIRCSGQKDKILKITLNQGEVIEVFSDGAEKEQSLDSAKSFANKFILSVVKSHATKYPSLYNLPPVAPKTKDDFKQEWK